MNWQSFDLGAASLLVFILVFGFFIEWSTGRQFTSVANQLEKALRLALVGIEAKIGKLSNIIEGAADQYQHTSSEHARKLRDIEERLKTLETS